MLIFIVVFYLGSKSPIFWVIFLAKLWTQSQQWSHVKSQTLIFFPRWSDGRRCGTSTGSTWTSRCPPILPKVTNISPQIFVTYTFNIFVTFNHHSLVGQVVYIKYFYNRLIRLTNIGKNLVASIIHKFVSNFTHICKKILQICVWLGKSSLIGLGPGVHFAHLHFGRKSFPTNLYTVTRDKKHLKTVDQYFHLTLVDKILGFTCTKKVPT
jgi:hypothetical protein